MRAKARKLVRTLLPVTEDGWAIPMSLDVYQDFVGFAEETLIDIHGLPTVFHPLGAGC